jgi:hypothetical protein
MLGKRTNQRFDPFIAVYTFAAASGFTWIKHRWSALEKENPPATGIVVRVVVMKHR